MHDEPPLRVLPSPPDLGSDERELAARVGASHGVARSSGTAALHLALRLSHVASGDEVLGIEVRPLWKPMHRQPSFTDCRMIGGGIADGPCQQGVCLPSGSSVTEIQQDESCTAVRLVLRA
jgi:dTDP-4-amino-4,6-dideoxygalactose transaminase